MDDITPDEFVETIFPADMLTADEMAVIACPDSFVPRETGQRVDYYRQTRYSARRLGRLTRDGAATYFCVSTVAAQERRQVKKRLQDCRRAFVLAVDDIGTKCDRPPLAPSYVLETSAGNEQWGYLLDVPHDVSTAAGRHDYDAVLYSLAMAGLNDPGFRSASRLARLPGSMHRSGHRARVTVWEPERAYMLADLLPAMGVERQEPLRGARGADVAPGKHTRLDDVDDYAYDWLVATGRVLGASGDWVHIVCPWREEHTDGRQGATSTSYSPLDYGTAGRGFSCLHAHCVTRSTADFLEWIAGAGAGDYARMTQEHDG